MTDKKGILEIEYTPVICSDCLKTLIQTYTVKGYHFHNHPDAVIRCKPCYDKHLKKEIIRIIDEWASK